MSFTIKFGNFLFRHLYFLYKPLYTSFKLRQDKFEIDLLKKHVKPGMKIVDVGANIGFYAQILSKLVGPEGKVHCFEPDHINFSRLQNQVKGLRNVVIHQKAVGPKTEMLRIYTSPNLNVDHRTYEPEVFESVHEVQAISLDDYLRDQNHKVDFIKMDIQGFEMQALKGMEEVLAANSQLSMISEFWPYGLKKAGSSVSDFYKILAEKGFKVQILRNNSLQQLDLKMVQELEGLGEAHYFNILAIK